jgi:hypothetical protein
VTGCVAGPVPRRRAWAVVALALALCAGVLVSCTSATSSADTVNALLDAGFADANVDFSTSDGFDALDVTADPGTMEGDRDSLAELAAGVVWTNFPLRFDELDVVLTGRFDGDQTFYTYDELYELFGPRPPGFDDRSIGDDFARTGLVVAAIVGGALLMFVVVAAVTIVLIVRASRRRARAAPPSWPPDAGRAMSQWPPGPPSTPLP